jgi:hypothetical protein
VPFRSSFDSSNAPAASRMFSPVSVPLPHGTPTPKVGCKLQTSRRTTTTVVPGFVNANTSSSPAGVIRAAIVTEPGYAPLVSAFAEPKSLPVVPEAPVVIAPSLGRSGHRGLSWQSARQTIAAVVLPSSHCRWLQHVVAADWLD